MLSNVQLQLLVKCMHMLCYHQFHVFLCYLMFHVTQFCDPVSKYAKLASQMYGQDAENVIEAKITDRYVIQTYRLQKVKIISPVAVRGRN